MAERRARQGRRGRGGGIGALPAIKTAIGLALAGLDHRPYLATHDSTERMVEVIVGDRVAERRQQDRETEQHNLAVQIGNNVNRVVVPALDAALKSIARATRG